MKKYSIGVMFCGGCNCYFDREEFFEELKKNLSELCDFFICSPDAGNDRDLILLINGCQSECLVNSEHGRELVLINNKNYMEAEKIIREKLAERNKRRHGL
ncbi:MAG TPA: hypothetical protein IAC50_00805 [Candidatus Copromorpha excrementigallinarum]|uniref:Uncharacterized protein n=1 Tax=Candidatus Allocopromorpha excrementigallinarum TaxID=2840742 RepID=A0A9D1I0K9_9FIRM|nr:hypothetical protein [Candidatus Copromorpha excrementigallinarum]